jgi:hypothetical protein
MTTLHAWHEPTHAGSIVWETKFVSTSYSECEDWGKQHGIRRQSGVLAGEAYKMGESDITWVKANHPEWLPTPQPTMDYATLGRIVTLVEQSAQSRARLVAIAAMTDTQWEAFDTIDDGIDAMVAFVRNATGRKWSEVVEYVGRNYRIVPTHPTQPVK